MEIAIRVENLGKQYVLGEFQGYRTFRESLVNLVTAPLRQLRAPKKDFSCREEPAYAITQSGSDGKSRTTPSPISHLPSPISHPPSPISHPPSPSTIWALRDVSFEVPRGQVLGIIGRNGAGKSTLLKILSRITEPTTGRVEIHGRVGSLLEVGTGFHPELTGRENIFVNGAILGMSRAEIKRKFDEIVDFAGVAPFLDTPVKRYSSGMQVRLAFAVAAHLEPEILIIDEVLAVGDAEFQKRCLGKMNEVSRSGRTVLFVSHNMAAVEGLCTRAVLLDKGLILNDGDVSSVLNSYFALSRTAESSVDRKTYKYISSVTVVDSFGNQTAGIVQGADLSFQIVFSTRAPIYNPRLAIRVFSLAGQRILTCHTDYHYPHRYRIEDGTIVQCTIRDCRLTPGVYTVELQLDDRTDILCKITNATSFEVYPRDLYGTHKHLPYHTAIWHPDITWHVSKAAYL